MLQIISTGHSRRKEQHQHSDTDNFSILVVVSTGLQVLLRILYRL